VVSAETHTIEYLLARIVERIVEDKKRHSNHPQSPSQFQKVKKLRC
jgi:hypothetical protein